jgi:hypothetical protein
MIVESEIENPQSKLVGDSAICTGEDAKRLSLLQIFSALVTMVAIEDARIPDFNRQAYYTQG